MLAASLALALSASPDVAAAVTQKLAPAFSGTIISTYDDGRHGRLNLAKDGTYRYRGRSNAPSSGVWTVKSESTICLKQKQPKSIPFSYCTPIPSGKTWKAKAAGGERITLHLVPGKS